MNCSNAVSKITDSPINPIFSEKTRLEICWELVAETFSLEKEIFNNCETQTPLICAVINQNVLLCKKIIALGVDVNEKNISESTPLVSAISFQSTEIMSLLLENGGDSNGVFLNVPLLIWSIYKKNISACELLLNYGARVDQDTRGPFPPILSLFSPDGVKLNSLLYAYLTNQLEIMNLLLSRGANPSSKNCMNGKSILHSAVETKNYPIIQLLIDFQADINCVDHHGFTPLHYATLDNSIRIIKILLTAQADINKRDFKGRTPLRLAMQMKLMKTSPIESMELIRFLIENGADINLGDYKDRTPLHVATLEGLSFCVQLLISYKARTDMIDKKGNTPLLNIYNKNRLDLHFYSGLVFQDNSLTTDLINLRLLGHRFSVKAALYECLNVQTTYPALAKTVTNYIKEDFLTRSYLSYLHIALNEGVDLSLTGRYFIEQIKKNHVVAIPVGWSKHVTTIVICGDRLIKCNRGNRSNLLQKPGMTIYTISRSGDLEKAIDILNEPFRNSLKSEEEIEGHRHFFEEGINELLKLKKEHEVELKEQKSNNCAWIAAKTAIKAMLIIYEIAQGKNIETAVISTRSIYKSIILFDRLKAIQDVQAINWQQYSGFNTAPN